MHLNNIRLVVLILPYCIYIFYPDLIKSMTIRMDPEKNPVQRFTERRSMCYHKGQDNMN